MSLRYTAPYFEWIDGDGVPAAGWKLYFFVTGTDTPLATYSNAALSIANANPVIANADGYWGAIFLQVATYKVVLKDADDVVIWTADPVSGSGGGSGGGSSAIRTTTISSAVTINDGTVIVNSSGPTTQTLASAASATGLTFTIKNINTGTVTVAGTIDAVTNYTMPFQNQSASFMSNGVSYIVV